MKEKIKANDFVEIEFDGKADGNLFDTTDKEKAKQIGVDAEIKPAIISVGNEMLLKGFDESLEGKEIGKKYSIKLPPEKAFGKRESSLIKIIPLKVFTEKKINPEKAMVFQMDNHLVRILSVSGGRVTGDFNNPLAGKEIEYEFIIKRKIIDLNEKIDALQDFFFKQKFDFEIKDKKLIFKDLKIKTLVDIFKDKFEKLLGLSIIFEKEIKSDNKNEKNQKGNNKTEK